MNISISKYELTNTMEEKKVKLNKWKKILKIDEKDLDTFIAYLEMRLDGSDSKEFRSPLERNADGSEMNVEQLTILYSNLDAAREEWAAIK